MSTPMPNPSETLDSEQMARVGALTVARALLQATGFANTTRAPDPFDLITVAQFVLTGADPLLEFRREHPERAEELDETATEPAPEDETAPGLRAVEEPVEEPEEGPEA